VKRTTFILLIAASLVFGQAPAGKKVTLAAAADLRYAMEELIAQFRGEHPDIAVTASYGSSGNFYSQLQNRAPFDIFFSADLEYPRKLAAQGLTLPGSEFSYAVGRIVVWVSSTSPIDVQHLGIAALRDPSIAHIAIANPQHAPYGKAAEAAMRSLGVYAACQPKLVFGENISQTLQFVQSGAAEIGIVALSLAVSPAVAKQGKYWEVPLSAYPKMEQGGAIMKWTKDAASAQALRTFILGMQGRALLKRYGFFPPGE
jgi:molybdate transport system substrate-binding protein